MNLVSCKNCGLVYDADIINFPQGEIYDFEDSEIARQAENGFFWECHGDYKVYKNCSCGGKIFKKQ